MATKTKDELDAEVAGATVPSMFLDTVGSCADGVALRWKDGDAWREWTWNDYADRVARVAAGLRDLGLRPGERVVLLMRNRPEFHVVDLAVLCCGATPVSIYNSSSPDQIEYLASHSEAVLAVAEDVDYLERILKVRGGIDALRAVIVIDDPDGLAPADVTRWDDLVASEPLDLRAATANAGPDDLATVIYTSGTTGPPKGVMLSHYNVCFTARGYQSLLERDIAGLRVISYLPMAHIAERMSSHYLGVLGGLEVTTCPDAGLLSAYLPDVRPQSFFGVPRVWEKLHAGVLGALAEDPRTAQQLDDAVAAATPLAAARAQGRPLTDEEQKTWDFLDDAAFRKVRQSLGLDDVVFAVSGAAPITVELLEWFRAIGVPLSEIYGMSESTGPITWDPYRVRIGTVGRAFPGCAVELLDDGEVVCRGGNVFVGYLKDTEKTAEALDQEGWLHSGDIGEIDDDGYLRIVDRKKELIITAGGKNISPANIEAALKSFPLIGQAAVIGDNRPFVSALLVLDPEVAPGWARQHGASGDTLGELAEDPVVREEIQRCVDEANARFSQVERVKKFTILHDEWLADSEELTPTMKLKRRGISHKYRSEIEALYSR